MPALKDIFQFERWLEEGFKEILTGIVESIYTSLNTTTAQTPRIVIRAIVEGINGKHEHVFTDGGEDEGGHFRSVFDAYDAIIETEIVTNRTTEEKSNAHFEVVGAVRSLMQRDGVYLNWPNSSPLMVNDVRQNESERDVDNELNLDRMAIKHYVLFNVKPESWPANFN